MFRTDDGFLYEEGCHFTFVSHKGGGYRKYTLGDGKEYLFSNYNEGSSEEQKLFGRIREILRMVESFKEKVRV